MKQVETKNKAENLNKARQAKDDEFYTLVPDVAYMFEKISSNYNLNNYTIDLPFDGEQSEFYKYAVKNKLKVNIDCKFDYKKFNYSDNGIVISNPPFSQYRDILKFFIKKKINFVLVAPLNLLWSSVFVEYFNNFMVSIDYYAINKFIRPDGSIASVPCVVITNLKWYKVNHWIPVGGFVSVKDFNDWSNEMMKSEQLTLFEVPEYKTINKSGLEPGVHNVYYPITYIMSEYTHTHRNISTSTFITKDKRTSFVKLLYR